MVEFHDDLIEAILLRLPVKSILCCRCVCKHWCALIDTKDFINQHLNHSIQTKTNHTLIVQEHFLYSLYSVGLYSPHDQAVELVLPVKKLNHLVAWLVGSCHGLLCLSVFEKQDVVIIIWNHTTRKHVKLPAITVENPFREDGLFKRGNSEIIDGFGYDSVSDDYHVVLFVQVYEDEDRNSFQSEANVYSMRSNTWRKVRDFPNYLVAGQMRSVLACGALHWFILMDRGSEFEFDPKVASFDLVTEECRIVAQPDFAHIGSRSLILSELGGCLSIVCEYVEIGVVHLWVMKDYGVTESWTQLLTVGFEMIKPFEPFMPLVYSKSGDEVLLMVNLAKLLWYNLEKKTFKTVDVRGLPDLFNPVICLESLVSLGEEAENDEIQSAENEGAKKEGEEKFLSVGFKLVL